MHQPIDGDGSNGSNGGGGRWKRFRRVNRAERATYLILVVDPADRANGAVGYLSTDHVPDAMVQRFAVAILFGTSPRFEGLCGLAGIVGAPS